MLWFKALHVIFMVTWFAGLFYLPRLFVYHAQSDPAQTAQRETFKVMQRKLLALTHIGGVLTVLFGSIVLVGWVPALAQTGWMQIKLLLVLLLIVYHLWCIRIVAAFREDRNTRSHIWYRWFNELPVLLLFGIVIMVIVRPG